MQLTTKLTEATDEVKRCRTSESDLRAQVQAVTQTLSSTSAVHDGALRTLSAALEEYKRELAVARGQLHLRALFIQQTTMNFFLPSAFCAWQACHACNFLYRSLKALFLLHAAC